jgi:hypothetical protein
MKEKDCFDCLRMFLFLESGTYGVIERARQVNQRGEDRFTAVTTSTQRPAG